MNVESTIELFVAIHLFTIGLSHFVQPKIWADFFSLLSSKGYSGVIINALIALAMGSIIVSFYPIWTWPKVLITLYGFSQIIKAFIYLTFPSVGLKSMKRVTCKNAHSFRWAGLALSCFAGTIFLNLIITP